MIFFDTTSRKLQIVLAAAKATNDCPWVCSYADIGSGPTMTPDSTVGTTSGTIAANVFTPPGSGVQRQLKWFSVFNADTAPVTPSLTYVDSSTSYNLITATLQVGETLTFDAESGWSVIGTNGAIKTSQGVSSVALTVPSRQTVAGSPITTDGTLAITDNTQNANLVFAGPGSGSAAAPGFRSLVAADIPSLSGSYLPLTGGTLSGPVNVTDSANADVFNTSTNSNAGGGARIGDSYFNASHGFDVGITGTGYTPSGLFQPDAAFCLTNASGGLTMITLGASPIIFAVSNAEVARLNTSGNLNMASGKGIQFNGSAVLSDYEVGTFTPTDVSGAGLTFAIAQGSYIKIGNLVTVVIVVLYPTTVDTSPAKIGGLPYTCGLSSTSSRAGVNAYTIVRVDAGNIYCQPATGDGTPILNSVASANYVLTTLAYSI